MMRNIKSRLLSVWVLSAIVFQLGLATIAFAQVAAVKIIVTADHPDWVYKVGEPVTFTVSAKRGDQLLKDVKLNYAIGLERMKPTKSGSIVLSNDQEQIIAESLDKPGFLRCLVTAQIDGKSYKGMATAAFEPEKIKQSAKTPKDFVAFWDKAKADAAKIPMDAKMELVPGKSTATVNVYEVSFQNYKLGSRIYGMLSMPKKDGKYPAILRVPGAGVRRYSADMATADKGFIVLQIGVHGIPVNMADSVYARIANTELKGYPFFNNNNRDEFYFKRVFMGCIRANDFLFSLPQFDGKNLAVAGGSQGGALTIATSALDNRVKYMVSYFPGLCDQTGYLSGRTGGWPHSLRDVDKATKEQIETSKYYDMVNFSSLLKIPGFYSWGFNDETCPPTTCYAAYNNITAPKELFIVKEAGHEYRPEQRVKMNEWLVKKLSGK